jgi:hypothetical protein
MGTREKSGRQLLREERQRERRKLQSELLAKLDDLVAAKGEYRVASPPPPPVLRIACLLSPYRLHPRSSVACAGVIYNAPRVKALNSGRSIEHLISDVRAFAPVLFALQSHATCHRSLIVCRRWFIVFEIHLSHLRVRFADKLFETLRVSHWCVPDLRD